jgi:hypothetical protein
MAAAVIPADHGGCEAVGERLKEAEASGVAASRAGREGSVPGVKHRTNSVMATFSLRRLVQKPLRLARFAGLVVIGNK